MGKPAPIVECWRRHRIDGEKPFSDTKAGAVRRRIEDIKQAAQLEREFDADELLFDDGKRK